MEPRSSESQKRKRTCDHVGCDYACARSDSLVVHMRTHSGEKPFKCKEDGCDYACAQSGSLFKHVRTHSG